MRVLGIILRREIEVRLRDWRFWITILSIPVLIVGVGGVIALLERDRPPITIYLPAELRELNLPSTKRLRFVSAPAATTLELKAQLREKEGFLLRSPDTGNTATFLLYTKEPLPSVEEENLQRLLQTALQQERLRKIGLSPEKWAYLTTPPTLKTFVLSAKGEESQSASAVSFLGTLLSLFLFMIIISAGSQILLSVLEEKTNRLAEYLLTHISPAQLLTGKLLASLFLTFVQAGIWIAFGWGGLYAAGTKATPLLNALSTSSWGWTLCFLLGGILLYAFLYAAAGASSDSVTELSSFGQALQWPLLLSFILVSTSAMQPQHPITIFLSHFPLTSPLAMPLRFTLSEIKTWEKLLSLFLLGISILGGRYLAARLYQRALLLYGQKLSWKAIWHLLRG
ncbi:MAG: ABC transporter permease [Bacteroidia bacterium]|nr:ABC transporter permease [Bacteroidia bacterium]